MVTASTQNTPGRWTISEKNLQAIESETLSRDKFKKFIQEIKSIYFTHFSPDNVARAVKCEDLERENLKCSCCQTEIEKKTLASLKKGLIFKKFPELRSDEELKNLIEKYDQENDQWKSLSPVLRLSHFIKKRANISYYKTVFLIASVAAVIFEILFKTNHFNVGNRVALFSAVTIIAANAAYIKNFCDSSLFRGYISELREVSILDTAIKANLIASLCQIGTFFASKKIPQLKNDLQTISTLWSLINFVCIFSGIGALGYSLAKREINLATHDEIGSEKK